MQRRSPANIGVDAGTRFVVAPASIFQSVSSCDMRWRVSFRWSCAQADIHTISSAKKYSQARCRKRSNANRRPQTYTHKKGAPKSAVSISDRVDPRLSALTAARQPDRGLLDARNIPVVIAVHRTLDVPDLVETLGRRAVLAEGAVAAHARNVLVAVGDEVQQLRGQRHHLGVRGRAVARLYLHGDLGIDLGRGVLADVGEVAFVGRRLQADEMTLGRAQDVLFVVLRGSFLFFVWGRVARGAAVLITLRILDTFRVTVTRILHVMCGRRGTRAHRANDEEDQRRDTEQQDDVEGLDAVERTAHEHCGEQTAGGEAG